MSSFATTFSIENEDSRQPTLKLSTASSSNGVVSYASAICDLRSLHDQAMVFFAASANAAVEEGTKTAAEPKTPMLGPAASELSEESSTEFEESDPKQPRLEQ